MRNKSKSAPSGPYYRVGEAILLLFWSMAPILWWVAVEQAKQINSEIPPNAFIICSILITFSLSYGLSVRLYPGLGWMSDSKVEKWARSYLKFGSLAMVFVVLGDLPIEGDGISRWFYLVYYAITVAHLLVVHFFVSYYIPIVIPEDEKVRGMLTAEQLSMVDGLHLVGASCGGAAILTLLVYAIFRYPSQIPNHATIFGVFSGLILGLLVYVRTQNKNT